MVLCYVWLDNKTDDLLENCRIKGIICGLLKLWKYFELSSEDIKIKTKHLSGAFY